MIRAITFDLDNTLIDFMKLKRLASNAAAKAMVKAGLKMNVKQCEKELFDSYIQDIEGESVFQDFLKSKKQLNERILAAGINAYLRVKQNYLKPYPSVKPILLKLKTEGIKIAIVTDAPRLKAFMRLDAMGIADIFDAVVGFEDTGKKKPSQFPFKKALKLLKVKPSETMHVGDWPERDIVGAKKAGMLTCYAKYGNNHSKSEIKADFQIDSFKELLQWSN